MLVISRPGCVEKCRYSSMRELYRKYSYFPLAAQLRSSILSKLPFYHVQSLDLDCRLIVL
jgi:hypothetical protein